MSRTRREGGVVLVESWSSLRVRVVLAILGVAAAPWLFVFAWSQVDRSVPGRAWTTVRDATDEAAAIAKLGPLDGAALRRVASTRRIRLRVFDAQGDPLFDDDEDHPMEGFDQVERFFLREPDLPSVRELDDDLGPILLRPEILEARKRGSYVACGNAPIVFCQAIRVVPLPGQEEIRIVHAEASSQRLVQGVYGLRRQLARLSLVTIPLALLLALYTAGRVVRPIESLRRQVLEKAKAASPRAALHPERRDEVAVLTEAFNALLAALDNKRLENEAFVADLVHEMKSPVAAVRAAAESLARAPPDGERAERLGRVLGECSGKLDKLVTQCLDLARAEAGMPNEVRTRVDVTELLEGMVGRMRDDPRFAKVGLACSADGGVRAQVHGVGHRLEALFRELLENAASFAGDGGEVNVHLSSLPTGLRVTVADTGPGIADEDLPRVFTRFFTTRGRQRGTGLGLALVRAVAAAHGGEAHALPTRGKGATFEVTLPLG